MRIRNKKAVSFLLVITLLFSLFGTVTVSADDVATATEVENENSTSAKRDELQQQLNDVTSKYDELSERQTAIKAKIANATSLKQQQQALKESIDEQIEVTTAQIELLEEKIELLENRNTVLEGEINLVEVTIGNRITDIEEKEAELQEKKDKYDETYENFKLRLRALYMQGNKTELELLFSSESYSDMLTAIECKKRIATYDTTQMSSLIRQKETLELEMADLEVSKEELESCKAELEQDKLELEASMEELAESQEEVLALQTELNEQMVTAENLISEYSSQVSEANQEQAEILAAMQSAKAEMNTIFAELSKLSTQTEYVGGTFLWPLPGYSTITSTFGESRSYYSNGRYVTDVHTGTDISGSGVYGAPIVAANTGTVYAATWSNYGYGNYVIIDHGGGYSTLYGHCSSLAVTEGQTVTKGDVIAYVGSTGNSTGPHLHFEVRINGTAVDAMQYFTQV